MGLSYVCHFGDALTQRGGRGFDAFASCALSSKLHYSGKGKDASLAVQTMFRSSGGMRRHFVDLWHQLFANSASVNLISASGVDPHGRRSIARDPSPIPLVCDDRIDLVSWTPKESARGWGTDRTERSRSPRRIQRRVQGGAVRL